MHSILSYPNRGPWGKSSYPGNCSGFVIRDLIQHFKATHVADPCEGSGTTKDVCAELHLPYWGSDLRKGFDLAELPVMAAAPFTPDLIILHPPYFKIVRYSGHVWGDAPHPRDLSHEEDWGEYLRRLHRMVGNCVGSLAPGGRLALIIGDVRQGGAYYSAQAEVLHWHSPERIDSVMIKAQHHVRSDQTVYNGRLVRIMHEYVIVIRGREKTDDER